MDSGRNEWLDDSSQREIALKNDLDLWWLFERGWKKDQLFADQAAKVENVFSIS